MNQLIPIKDSNINGEVVQTVNARELHGYLGIRKDFSDWIKVQIERARLVEGLNYCTQAIEKSNPFSGGRVIARIEYHVTLDSAKHIAMMSGADKGVEVRDYFIECERKAKTQQAFRLPATFSEALRMLADSVEREEINRPKVEAFNTFLGAKNSQTMNEVSKALNIGRNTLFSILREHQILMHNNLPYQRYINSDYFTVREVSIKSGEETKAQTLVTAKGIEYIRKVLAGKAQPLNS